MTGFNTAGILLAAGLSSRMGQTKALLPWKGSSLIQYQIEQMQQAEIEEVIVVLGYEAEKINDTISKHDVKIVINERYQLGKSSSIQKGVSCLYDEFKGIFITAVDQPVPSFILKKMMKHLSESQAAAVIPTFEEKRGHPILFHGSLKNDLLHIKEETLGLRGVTDKFQNQISYLNVNDPSVLYNFNRPEDYVIRQEVSNESIGN